MNVMHIITDLNDGGAEAVLYRLCDSDKIVKHHVVSLMNEGKYGALLRDAGVQVFCLNMPRGRITPGGLWRLWQLLRQIHPQVVQTWMYHADLIGGVIARLAGVKQVFWGIRHSTLDTEKSRRSTIWVARLCARISSRIPSTIICCAQKALEVHRDLGYAVDKLRVIPNGYDLVRFRVDGDARAQLRAEWGVGNRWLLGMVGRFDPLKDHKNLLNALAVIKNQGVDFGCVLAGRDLDRNNAQLMTWLAEHNLTSEVRLLGQRTDIPDVMNALDVHVLSSSSEAFPNVVAEAMACGTPAVVTDVGDAAVIVGEVGWVVPPKDPEALADALLRAHAAMQSGVAWQARCIAARGRVQDHFSLERMIESYHLVWQQEQSH
ncbi:Glycosyltransferase involved in cell wall bisynthesis [Nitrosomonas eutropha]|uniref:Glycosyltransferase involved in cell wall bisynthesis n=1 Tax=Nitrosomonas eutropha TaxID=916 RepID=A0A1I7HBE4_9PROT|nr:glycosyltransferase [Nitrosomonas eutropha]SFU57912.1 Glycosyltransferase involved in cell wall bisynthesis [Nitrosomonas eutropha]